MFFFICNKFINKNLHQRLTKKIIFLYRNFIFLKFPLPPILGFNKHIILASQQPSPIHEGLTSQKSIITSRNVDPQFCQILTRLQASANTKERDNVITELKKTPYLLAAFLKMKRLNHVNFLYIKKKLFIKSLSSAVIIHI